MNYKKEVIFVILAALLFISGVFYRYYLKQGISIKPPHITKKVIHGKATKQSTIDTSNYRPYYHPQKWVGEVINDTVLFIADHLTRYEYKPNEGYDIWTNAAYK